VRGRDRAAPARTGDAVGRIRPLNAPSRAQVRTGRDDTPVRVRLRGRDCAVESVQERWRIDEGWWWARPVSRTYWRLVLADGRLVTVYEDLLDHTWWVQRA
jgi:hypothetical protein